MNKSRKDMSRGEIRRRRQLREQRERAGSAEDERYVPEELSKKSFLAKRKIELIFAVLLVAGIFTVISLAPDQKAIKELQDSIDNIITWQSLEFEQAFPHGYKVIAMREKDVVMTSFDTLPDDFKVDWKKMSVARIQANQLTQTNEKVEIQLNNIHYAPAAIAGESIVVTLSRHIGATASLGQFGTFQLVVKIIEDDGSSLFCLFGFRSL